MMVDRLDFGMPLGGAIGPQRTIRRLKTEPVDDEVVLRLIDLALRAPTASNAQRWEFIVVRDPKIKRALARLNRQLWRLYARIGRWATRHDAKRQRMLSAVPWHADHFQEAPVLVVARLKGTSI